MANKDQREVMSKSNGCLKCGIATSLGHYEFCPELTKDTKQHVYDKVFVGRDDIPYTEKNLAYDELMKIAEWLESIGKGQWIFPKDKARIQIEKLQEALKLTAEDIREYSKVLRSGVSNKTGRLKLTAEDIREYTEILSFNDIYLCENCWQMTKTIKGNCGKCKVWKFQGSNQRA